MNMKSKIESLPLYEKTYKFMLEVIGCIETFPKNSRFTLGDRIMDNSCELVAYLALAHQNWENPNTRQSCLEKYNTYKSQFWKRVDKLSTTSTFRSTFL